MPHDAMLEFAKPYIAAFKAGSPTAIIERDMLVYWHRPTLKNVECDATDSCGGKPDGWEVCYTSSDVSLRLTFHRCCMTKSSLLRSHALPAKWK
jgi:hypothetical protein